MVWFGYWAVSGFCIVTFVPSSSDHPLFYVVVIFFTFSLRNEPLLLFPAFPCWKQLLIFFNSGLFLQKFVGLYLFFDPLSSYPLHAFSFPFKKLFTFNNTVNKISFSFYSFFFLYPLNFLFSYLSQVLHFLSCPSSPPPPHFIDIKKMYCYRREGTAYGSY